MGVHMCAKWRLSCNIKERQEESWLRIQIVVFPSNSLPVASRIINHIRLVPRWITIQQFLLGRGGAGSRCLLHIIASLTNFRGRFQKMSLYLSAHSLWKTLSTLANGSFDCTQSNFACAGRLGYLTSSWYRVFVGLLNLCLLENRDGNYSY